jgi:hypothetical protein
VLIHRAAWKAFRNQGSIHRPITEVDSSVEGEKPPAVSFGLASSAGKPLAVSAVPEISMRVPISRPVILQWRGIASSAKLLVFRLSCAPMYCLTASQPIADG